MEFVPTLQQFHPRVGSVTWHQLKEKNHTKAIE
jgi:hypothetical protein